MSVTPSSPVVGVFTDRSMAEQAVGALYNAGFEHEQIRYSVPGNSGSFFEGLKSFFTGTSTNGDDLANDLTSMGLSDEEARYYSNEFSNGNIILAVQARGREQEALSVLHQYSAYNSHDVFNQATNYAQQSSDSTRQDNYGTSQPQNNAQNWQTQPQFGTSAEHPFEDREQDIVTPEHETDYQAPQTNVTTPEQEAESQHALSVATGEKAEDWTAQSDVFSHPKQTLLLRLNRLTNFTSFKSSSGLPNSNCRRLKPNFRLQRSVRQSFGQPENVSSSFRP